MSGRDWKLVIAGPSAGDHRQEVESLAEGLRVRGQCVFLDFVEGPTKDWLFRNARWFVLPSEHENFGIAVCEAIAHGCPVIVSDQVYSADNLEAHGRILPLEEGRWVQFFQTRLCDEEYRRLVMAADAKTGTQYAMDDVAKAWATLINDQVMKDGSL